MTMRRSCPGAASHDCVFVVCQHVSFSPVRYVCFSSHLSVRFFFFLFSFSLFAFFCFVSLPFVCWHRWNWLDCATCVAMVRMNGKSADAAAMSPSRSGSAVSRASAALAFHRPVKCQRCPPTMDRHRDELWVCVVCGAVGCNRYTAGHAVLHYETTGHRYDLGQRMNKQRWVARI
jgi:hypothetical protein